jgi:predicted MFS family arabinose efflux permease
LLSRTIETLTRGREALARTITPEAGPPDSTPDSRPTPAQATGMRFFRLDGLLAGGADSVLLHYLPLFALALGASNAGIGVMVAVIGLGAAAACLPGAWLSERWRHRKPFVLATRGASTLFLLTFAVVPLALGETALALAIVIAAAAARAFAVSLGEGAWTSLAADVVPAGMRGRYFSSRNLLMGAGGLAAVGMVGLTVTLLGPMVEWTAVWATVLALVAVSIWLYGRIPERSLAPSAPAPAEAESRTPLLLRDGNFAKYSGTVLLWTFSVWMAAPFFNVHLVKNLGASPAWVAGLLVVMAVFGLLGQVVVGRLADARGAKWLMAVSGISVSVLPIAWYFVSAPYQVLPINAAGGVLWAGYLLASFNFLLAISPPGQQRYYAAAYQTIVFLSMFLGPLAGGALAGAFGIKLLFMLSGGGRLLACLLFVTLVREERRATQAAPRQLPEGATARA